VQGRQSVADLLFDDEAFLGRGIPDQHAYGMHIPPAVEHRLSHRHWDVGAPHIIITALVGETSYHRKSNAAHDQLASQVVIIREQFLADRLA